MNTFKRKALFTAVLAGLGAAGTAEAVYLNPNGTGQVLVYPYYTVQQAQGASWNTYLSVVNTTTRAKAVKVRVLEGKTSAEVLDFNLFLSPNDVWTAAIIPADNTTTSPGAMVTADRSCTAPVGNLPVANGGQVFRNSQYATGGDALPGTGLERTREGYVEIIEMGSLTGTWAAAATHNSAGVPANCAVFQGNGLTPSSIEAPSGGLIGTGTLINVANGQDAGYKADALEAWRNAPIYSDPGQIFPSLADASPAASLVINAGGTAANGASVLLTAYRSDFATTSGVPAGARAVASVYMHSQVLNEYVLDQATASFTDWVITQPLKRVFVSSTTAAQPYTNVLTSSGACETIAFTFFNREEQSATASGIDFSPLPPNAPASSLCWESNVLSIRNTSLSQFNGVSTATSPVLGSVNLTNVNVTASSNFQNGWAQLSFTGTGATTQGMGATTSNRVSLGTDVLAPAVATGVATFFGLPVTGFMVRNFKNGNLSCPATTGTGTITCQGNYGSLFNHSYRNVIVP
ncbi:MAG TPA: hypothetical protein VFP44_09585 [Usitatibacter sp.]|nr:hypothetical protein [Usitatibacter sp.]